MKKIILFIAALIAVNLSQAQWEPDVRLTNDPADSWTSMSSCKPLVANGDTLHLVWQEFRDGSPEIYYKRSTDGGANWGVDTRLTNDPSWSYDASIALSGSVIHLVWSDHFDGEANAEIAYKRSEDGGSTWGPSTRLTFTDSWSESPSIAINDSEIHIVWYDWRNATGNWDSEIYYKRSTDGGLTWGLDVRLTDNPSYSGFPSIAISGQVVHVVWEDDRDGGDGEVYYKRSEDGGLSWSPNTPLTNDSDESWDPVVAVNDSDVHVVWMDMRDGGAYEVYYKRSTDGGLTWGEDTRLTNAVASSEYPTIAVSGSMVHVTWGDKRDMNYEIYYKQSEDAGITWEEDLRLTDAFGESNQPFVAASDSTVHVIWKESRDGNEEIYYKRNPTGNLIVGIEDNLLGNSEQPFTIYPNPASSRIHVQFNDYLTTESHFTIRNIFGKTLMNQSIRRGEEVINISMLPNGIYFATSKIGNKTVYTTKLIIAKD